MLQYFAALLPKTVALLFLLLALSTLNSTFASEFELNDDELLIVEVRVGNYILSDGLFIYSQPDYTLLPFQELMNSLEFAVEVDVDRQVVSGWFKREENTFNLDLGENTLFIQGKPRSLPKDLLSASDGFDLYIEKHLLEQWFEITLELNSAQLRLNVSSEDPLPIMQQLEREQRQAKAKTDPSQRPEHPIHPDRYRLTTSPKIRLQSSVTNDSGNRSRNYSIQGTGDILYHESGYSVTGRDGNIDDIRFSLKRKPLSKEDSLPLGISGYEFGDVLADNSNLINSSVSGTGIFLSRQEQDQLSSDFNQTTLEGNAPPGWEVELYRNNILIDFQSVGSDGQYLFEEIPVQFGENIFDVRLFGPQGQRVNRRERINIGDQMIKPGDFQFKLHHVKERDRLLQEPERLPNQTDSLTDNSGLTIQYGLLPKHSLGVEWVDMAPKPDEAPRLYTGYNLLSAWPLVSTNLKYVSSELGGEAANFIAAGALLDQNINLEFTQYSNFLSQTNRTGLSLRNINLKVSGSTSSLFNRSSNYFFELSENRIRDRNQYQITNRFGTSIKGYRLSNELGLFYLTKSDSDLNSSGTLNLNRSRQYQKLRSTLNYSLGPKVEAKTLSTTYDFKKPRSDLSYQLRLNLGLVSGAISSIGANLTYHYNYLQLSSSAQLDDAGAHRIEMGLQMHFGFNANPPFISLFDETLYRGGTVDALVFLDQDNDGLFGEEDEPLEGIGFTGRPFWKGLTTDEAGQVSMQGFSADNPTLLTMDTRTLDDPYLRPRQSAYYIYSHEGGVSDLYFPISMTSEVEGMVTFTRGEASKPGAGVRLQLTNLEGEVVSTVTTEFDGLYFFTFVPPGEYLLDIDPEQFDANQFTANTPFTITTDSDSGVSYAPDIHITAVTSNNDESVGTPAIPDNIKDEEKDKDQPSKAPGSEGESINDSNDHQTVHHSYNHHIDKDTSSQSVSDSDSNEASVGESLPETKPARPAKQSTALASSKSESKDLIAEPNTEPSEKAYALEGFVDTDDLTAAASNIADVAEVAEVAEVEVAPDASFPRWLWVWLILALAWFTALQLYLVIRRR